ncbi:Glycine/D-amino acid oxidase [Tistlia consotensis]|uniref:Glycine/D-amino acid oxidase n=1 Tax=Tistlia consotensis USBA 355 TaxID=560819 RepID=A0A1Y6BXU5_9PROT|nr:FAD-binding oxidoreductase [Tistlia consotensis]SMF25294.1 Glycine/D-amino acid oxidase [Tistlia consotensis USBA 355]SNR59603.1 Glycine/D-amino acid oxidase [Tistlia consotensis]
MTAAALARSIPDRPPSPASLWAATAPAAPRRPAASGELQAEVVVVGGGYSGLSTAHHLAERGVEALVLEANEVGWGASGRNGGVVSGKFRLGFAEMERLHGLETARRMHAIGREAVEAVEALIARYGIAAARLQANGNLRCAHNARQLGLLAAEADWLAGRLGDRSYELLPAGTIAEETGSAGFVGGLLGHHAATLHPLGYARGLAAGLERRGVRIREATPALRVRRDGAGLLVETPEAAIRAGKVVLATNAYSDLTPASDRLRRSLVPFRSAIIATAPLPPALDAGLLARERSYSETRRMMRWFRKVEGRIVFGGRGAFGKTDSEAAFEGLRRAMVGLFPELADVRVAYRWSGLVGMTLDKLPHVGRLEAGPFEGRLAFAAGFNGAGVALSSLIGRYLAAFLCGETPEVALLDAARLRPIPCPALREPAVRLTAGLYQFLDFIGR